MTEWNLSDNSDKDTWNVEIYYGYDVREFIKRLKESFPRELDDYNQIIENIDKLAGEKLL